MPEVCHGNGSIKSLFHSIEEYLLYIAVLQDPSCPAGVMEDIPGGISFSSHHVFLFSVDKFFAPALAVPVVPNPRASCSSHECSNEMRCLTRCLIRTRIQIQTQTHHNWMRHRAGLAVGLVVTGVLFGIISSSVSTVIVCFASNPVDFETNHPKLSQEMRNAWREVWPGCMDVVDMRVAVATFMDSTRSMPEQRAFFPSGEQQPLIS
mmetsp:Transcript_15309/g.42340  ORF Transcript_15309/g.42340 Transcript_15309/m.42340 type:complete len:207 (-) Transcript_15309:202-822(-)